MKKYAFLFGCSSFPDPSLLDLSAPENDIGEFSELLKDDKIGCFTDATSFANSDIAHVQTKLIEFLNARDRDDFVLIYYSGHGLLDRNNRLYLAMSETRAEHPDVQSIDEN